MENDFELTRAREDEIVFNLISGFRAKFTDQMSLKNPAEC